jgi:hypothetical protein
MLTGYLSAVGDGWTNVFYMLYGAALCAGLLLTRLVMKEAMVMMKESTSTSPVIEVCVLPTLSAW